MGWKIVHRDGSSGRWYEIVFSQFSVDRKFRLTDPQFHVHQGRKKGHGCCNGILLLGRQRRKDTKVKQKSLADGL